MVSLSPEIAAVLKVARKIKDWHRMPRLIDSRGAGQLVANALHDKDGFNFAHVERPDPYHTAFATEIVRTHADARITSSDQFEATDID